jgi:uncharacterized protein
MRKLIMLLLVSGVVTSCHTQPRMPALEKAKNNNTVLWEVTGKNTKKPFYIMGTMHLMCREDAQLSKNLKEVLKRSDLIYFELDMDDVMGMMSGMSAMRMKNGVKLKDLVSPEEYTRIKNYFNKNGALPFNMVENFKPMLLASTVTEEQMSCKTQSGVEMMMMEENDGKKEILGLETMADQAGIFDSIPYKDQVKELLKLLDSTQTGNTGEGLKELVSAYKKQDLKKIEAITLESEPGLKDYMDLLLYKRNRNWITKIKQVTGEKTIIFAVGAGHLVGKVGVLELLKKEGYALRPLKN